MLIFSTKGLEFARRRKIHGCGVQTGQEPVCVECFSAPGSIRPPVIASSPVQSVSV